MHLVAWHLPSPDFMCQSSMFSGVSILSLTNFLFFYQSIARPFL